MASNSERVLHQLMIAPAVSIGAALVLWPVSFGAASETSWAVGASFMDLWSGALAIASFLGAAVATVCVIGTLYESLNEWFKS